MYMIADNSAADWIPTPAEIAEATARIRATWSEEERQRRYAYGWRLPITAPSQEREEADND